MESTRFLVYIKIVWHTNKKEIHELKIILRNYYFNQFLKTVDIFFLPFDILCDFTSLISQWFTKLLKKNYLSTKYNCKS